MASRTIKRFPNHSKLDRIELKISEGPAEENPAGVRVDQLRIKTLTFTGNEIIFSYQTQPASRIFHLESADKFLAADFSQLHFDEEYPSDYIKRVLGAGIIINKKRYNYLGQSNSQIKDKKCILLQADPHLINQKLNGLGDWSNFTSVAKLSKRIGLLFSAGQNSLKLSKDNYEMIEDIERHGHCFTDGCGHMSKKIVTMVTKRMCLTFRNAKHRPSVIQIRYQGFKGILLLGQHLQGIICQFRKSMLKFSYTGPDDFCVVDYSKPYTFGRLNMQIIMLLSSLGVPDEAFIGKQCEHYERLEAMFTDMPTAFEYLLINGEVGLAGDLFENGFTGKVKQYLNKSYRHELDTSVKEKRRANGSDQIEKLRIIVKESRLAFAAADPTHVLAENQCFFRPTIANKPKTITGKIFCVRNPCYHAGDIIVLDAVHLPECQEIVDVLLFSVNGTCPTAHRSSGGDLDGDRFFVCWDEDLMPRQTVESYGYPSSEERKSFKKITRENMIEYFACYSNVGVARCAELFQKWADAKGVRSEECVQINALFSHAVDGQTVQIPEKLLQPPAVDETSLQSKIWNRLVTLAREYRSERSRCRKMPPEPCRMDEEELELFNEYDSHEATDYEIFNFLLRWCHTNDMDIEKFVPYVNFATFTDVEKLAALATGKLTREHLYNALYMSEILVEEYITFFTEQFQHNWKLFHRRDGYEASACVTADLHRAVSNHRRVLIVLEFDHNLSFCIILNGVFKPNIHNDANGKIEVHAFEQHGRVRHKKPCTGNFMLRFNEQRFDIFLAHPGTDRYQYSFVWLGIPSKLDARVTTLNDLKLETKISVALEKLGYAVQKTTSRIRKITIKRSEVYVLANRDDVRTTYEVANPTYEVPLEMADNIANYNPANPANPESDSDRRLLGLGYTDDLNQLTERLLCWLKYGLYEKSVNACAEYLETRPRPILDIEQLVTLATQNPIIHYPLSMFGAQSPDVVPAGMIVNLVEACVKASMCKDDTLIMEVVGNLLACAKPLDVLQISQVVTSLVVFYPNAQMALAYIDEFASLMEDSGQQQLENGCVSRRYFIRQLKLLTVETLEEFGSQTATPKNGYRAYERSAEDSDIRSRNHFNMLSVGSTSVRTRPGDVVLLKRLNRTAKEFISCLRATVVNSFPTLVVDVAWIPRDFTMATWRVEVVGNIIGFRNCVSAINHLCQKSETSSLARFLANPSEEPTSSMELEMNGNDAQQANCCDVRTFLLNPSQEKAIETAEKRVLTLWLGPAGTGKTKTIYEFILRLHEKQRDLPVLLTAATNVAVDNVAVLLRNHTGVNVVRIGDMKSIRPELHDITVEVQPDGSFRRTNIMKKEAKEMIRNAHVICATCVGCGNSQLEKLKFCFVIVDEASLVAEPICLVPLAKVCPQFLLVGDHKQLRPFCMPQSEENGYSVSLFERIFDENISCLLNTQYRMHPGIAEFPNANFYQGQLIDGVNATQRPPVAGFSWPNENIPVAFIQVQGDDGSIGGSKFNDAEVEALVSTLETILEAKDTHPEAIGIISLYAAQLDHLKQGLSSCRNRASAGKVEVNTADGFQGREKDLIMITCVRCNQNGNIGFLADPRRFNVMLTRARRGLIIFGDQTTLSSNSIWSDWFAWSKRHQLLATSKKIS